MPILLIRKWIRPRSILRRTARAMPRLTLLAAALILSGVALGAADQPQPATFPLDQVKPGLNGVAYTIFAGDQIEKFDLVVLGILPNLLGPKQSIIVVQLKGEKVEHTGVVAGMSGSP